MIKYIFFDLGLTLVENGMPKRYRRAMESQEIYLSSKRAEEVYHLANKYFMRERPGEMGKGNRKCFEEYVSYICRLLHEESKAQKVVLQLIADEKPIWKAFPFALSVMKELRDMGMKLGLISNWDHTCRDVLEANELTDLLDVIVISSEEKVEKPDKRIFQKALALAGVTPDECIYVGDNYYDDALGANQLGIRSYIINSPDFFGIEELKEKEINVISDIREIPFIIKRENGN